ncbi:MAG TPA: SHOCT domain-containing protein [Solirubrobacter sp.]|nr:SHOCT domain-containing protein [Solirubrobacter sp.]
MFAADYPFLDIFWTMLVFFMWVIWFWILITVMIDIFRRRDISGWLKAVWVAFVVFLPYLGVFIYLIAQGKGMAERRSEDVRASQAAFDDRVRAVAGASGGGGADPADQIHKAKQLLDSGAISQEEFDRLKAKALA